MCSAIAGLLPPLTQNIVAELYLSGRARSEIAFRRIFAGRSAFGHNAPELARYTFAHNCVPKHNWERAGDG